MTDKIAPVRKGHQRAWTLCGAKGCGRVAYRDYVPYSLSNPILVMPCGHSGHRSDGAKSITADEAIQLLLAQKVSP